MKNMKKENNKITPADIVEMRDLRPDEKEKSLEYWERNPNPKLNKKKAQHPKLNKKKAQQVILYILNKLGPTDEKKLWTLLYFIDFDYYELYEEHFMGFKYRKVPDNKEE